MGNQLTKKVSFEDMQHAQKNENTINKSYKSKTGKKSIPDGFKDSA